MASPSSCRLSDSGLDSFRQNVHAEAGEDRVLQALDVPIFGMDFDRAELVHHIAENAGDVVFEDEFFLLHALEQLAAQAVDRLALLVHDVVILEQMFAGLEVLGFDGLLRGGDAAGDQPRFDGNAFFHAQTLQQVRNPLLGEDAHQVIFE